MTSSNFGLSIVGISTPSTITWCANRYFYDQQMNGWSKISQVVVVIFVQQKSEKFRRDNSLLSNISYQYLGKYRPIIGLRD